MLKLAAYSQLLSFILSQLVCINKFEISFFFTDSAPWNKFSSPSLMNQASFLSGLKKLVSDKDKPSLFTNCFLITCLDLFYVRENLFLFSFFLKSWIKSFEFSSSSLFILKALLNWMMLSPAFKYAKILFLFSWMLLSI